MELYASDNGGDYPPTGSALKCLGYSDSEECLDGVNGLNSLITDLVEYYPGLPKNDDFIINLSTLETTGIMYRCDSVSNCFTQWYLPANQSCISGVSEYSIFGITRCEYRLKCPNGESGVNCN